MGGGSRPSDVCADNGRTAIAAPGPLVVTRSLAVEPVAVEWQPSLNRSVRLAQVSRPRG